MKKLSLTSLLVLSLTVSFLSCQKSMNEIYRNDVATNERKAVDKTKEKVYFGPAIALGNGKMRSFYLINGSGKPKELGVEITADALQSLPAANSEHEAYRFVLPLPEQAFQQTPYQHIYLDWNPMGHEPMPIYGVPHFDFHFYTIPSAVRESIPEFTTTTAPLFDNFPSPDFLPVGYIPIPGGAPQMGKHWVNPISPEFNGKPFTYTLIYGTYNGRVIFVEPMITLSTLLSGASYKLNIPQPKSYEPVNAYYPNLYNIYFNSDTQKYYVTLTNFEKQ